MLCYGQPEEQIKSPCDYYIKAVFETWKSCPESSIGSSIYRSRLPAPRFGRYISILCSNTVALCNNKYAWLSGTYCHITYHSQLLTRSYRSNKSFSGIQGADDGLWDREMTTSYRLQSISCTIRRHKHIFEPLSGRGHFGLWSNFLPFL